MPGLGLVCYVWVLSWLGRVALVITDPLARREDMAALLRQFHAAVPGMKQYVAVSRAVADALRSLDPHWTATVLANDYYGACVRACVRAFASEGLVGLAEGCRHACTCAHAYIHPHAPTHPKIRTHNDSYVLSR